jgi:hypothetical protein
MHYSLFPFTSVRDAGGPDLCEQLRVRGRPKPTTGINNLELLEVTIDLLREVPWHIQVDHCQEDRGDLRLAVVAADLGRSVGEGDQVRAGFFLQNSESGTFRTVACSRVYRVVCENGALVECEAGQSVVLGGGADWPRELDRVVARSFDADGLDRDTARFRSTTTQMLMTPYELLCNLVAQRVISEDEQTAIQREFDETGDCTLYGLINAVTRMAGRCRDFDEWKRAVELERLGGHILRGDYTPPVLDAVYQ